MDTFCILFVQVCLDVLPFCNIDMSPVQCLSDSALWGMEYISFVLWCFGNVQQDISHNVANRHTNHLHNVDSKDDLKLKESDIM